MKTAKTGPTFNDLTAFGLDVEISKYLKVMENIQSCSPLTLKAYRLDLRQAFGQGNITVRSESDLLGLIRRAIHQWKDLSLASRNRKAACLKSFLNYLYREGKTERELAVLVQAPRVAKRIPNFISVDEAMAIIEFFKTEKLDKKNSWQVSTQRILFYLLYGAGLRISEACNLRWSNFQQNKVLLIKGKGNKERLVALPKSLQTILQNYHRENQEEYLWGNSPMDPRAAYELIRQLGLKVGLLKPLHPHALRHSYATHLLSSGANLRTLQELLGHESLQATEKYTHLGIDQLARTMERFHPLKK